MRIVKLSDLKWKKRFKFTDNVEEKLGVHGIFWVSVPYGDNMTRVRGISSGKEYIVKYLEKSTSIEKRENGKLIGKTIEFPGEIQVIIE